jgi:hypothetical protein
MHVREERKANQLCSSVYVFVCTSSFLFGTDPRWTISLLNNKPSRGYALYYKCSSKRNSLMRMFVKKKERTISILFQQ